MNDLHHTQGGSRRRVLAVLAAATVAAAVAAPMQVQAAPAVTSWELAGEFNDVPPNGPVWFYGTNPGASFSTINVQFTDACSKGFWRGPGTQGIQDLPAIWHNTKMVPCGPTSAGQMLPPRSVILHPGMNGEKAVVRFKAPQSGKYAISGRFYAIDTNPTPSTQTAVHIQANVSSSPLQVYQGTISVPLGMNVASFTTKTVMLAAGQTLDFVVGAGPNNYFWFGSTGLHAVVELAGCYVAPGGPPCD